MEWTFRNDMGTDARIKKEKDKKKILKMKRDATDKHKLQSDNPLPQIFASL